MWLLLHLNYRQSSDQTSRENYSPCCYSILIEPSPSPNCPAPQEWPTPAYTERCSDCYAPKWPQKPESGCIIKYLPTKTARSGSHYIRSCFIAMVRQRSSRKSFRASPGSRRRTSTDPGRPVAWTNLAVHPVILMCSLLATLPDPRSMMRPPGPVTVWDGMWTVGWSQLKPGIPDMTLSWTPYGRGP